MRGRAEPRTGATAPARPPTPTPPPVSPYDVAIIGAGPAGLSAAIWLGRYLHSVVVVDSGDPRNWETRGVNGYLGLPRITPPEMRGLGRDEARRYDVTLVDAVVERVERCDDEHFVVHLEHGGTVSARRLLLAIGIRDVWPEIPGLERCYGDKAHVCPDCDGYEARDRKTVVIGTGRRAVGMVLALATWTTDLTLCTNGLDPDLDDALQAKLDELGVPTITDPVTRIHFREDTMRSLEFADRPPLGCEKLFFTIGQYPADDIGDQLGCERDEDGRIEVDRTQHTSVWNVFAAGDITPGSQLAIRAASEGAVAALAIHKSLLPEQLRMPER